MRSIKLGAAALCAAVAALAWTDTLRASPSLIGSGWPQGVIYDVDPTTGEATNPRSTGLRKLIGISWGEDGFLYGLAGRSRDIYRIDPETGDAEFMVNSGLASVLEGDLDFDPVSGNLFTVQTSTTLRGVSRELVSITLDTGALSMVGTLPGGRDPSAMAFDAAGSLFVLDTAADKLLTIDPATAELLASVDLSIQLGSVAGMDFDRSTGRLYVADGYRGGTDSLYTLDPETGDLELVGETGLRHGLAGLQFVPEPSTLCLLVAGALAAVARKRK